MPKFIVRVVLHNAKEPDDYDTLHEKMEAAQYYRTIISAEGKVFKLPPATYQAEADNWTREEIRDEVRKIASSVRPANAVLVTVSAGSAWVGLEKA